MEAFLKLRNISILIEYNDDDDADAAAAAADDDGGCGDGLAQLWDK